MEVVVREKGRITLPLSLRRRLGLKKGDALEIEIEKSRLVIKPQSAVTVESVGGILKVPEVDLEEIEGAIGASADDEIH